MDNKQKFNAMVGKILDNRYKVLEVVGIGGMAVVLKAEDTVMNRIVAIKVLNDEYNKDQAAVRRFVNESKAVAMLSHPNIVNIYDVAFGSDMKYIVMEYIDGIALNDYMQKKGKLTWKDAVHFADQILLALEHAHEKGIVHRDVKPQNIMLLKNGTVKVADFGIATLPNIETKAVQDKAIGTVYYMSPEQACGQPTDTAADLYSLGVMLYEMTTGVLPFDGETTLDIATKQVNELPKEPRSLEITIPRGLEQIILRAMEKNPKDRYDTAHTMRRMLQILKNNPSIVFADTNRNTASTVNTGEIAGNVDGATRSFDAVHSDTKIPISKTPVNANEVPPIKEQQNNHAERNNKVFKTIKKPKRNTSGHSVIEKKQEGSSKSTMFPIILGVAMAFIVVVIISGYVVLSSVLEDSTGVGKVYEFPSYIGKEFNKELEELIIADGFELKKPIKTQYDSSTNKNYVVSQDPVPGSKRKNPDLRLVVSLGSETKIMPDLTMCIVTNAEVYLRNMGIKPVIQWIQDDSVMKDYVIKTEPAEGEIVKAGDQVTIYVSDGDQITYLPMPELVGKTQQEAQQILTENNITNVSIITEKSARPTGEVLHQDILAGTSVPQKYAKINLTVSEYDETLDPNVPPKDLPVSGEVEIPQDPDNTDISSEPENPSDTQQDETQQTQDPTDDSSTQEGDQEV